MENKATLYFVLDLLISEYGWSLEYCLKLPGDVVTDLVNAITKRQHGYWKSFTKLSGIAVSAGFSGKLDEIDKIFDTENKVLVEDKEVDKVAWKGQVKSMWMKMKSGNKSLSTVEMKELADKFEEKWAKGESIDF